MPYYAALYDSDVMANILRWAVPHWGKAYSLGTYVCTTPWVDLMRKIYHKDLSIVEGIESVFLADYWFRQCSIHPKGRDPLYFRFQQELSAVSELRPNGITHVELIIAYDNTTKMGICLGVGVPVGAIPLNGLFSLHPFGPGIPGDGWFDDDDTHHVLHRYLDVESFAS